MKKLPQVKTILDSKYPGLYDKIKQVIAKSESVFDKSMKDSHLWEHSMHVSSVAQIISLKENVDPLAVIISALFHDAGKFTETGYHNDELPEELASMKLAKKILPEFKVDSLIIETVCNAIESLYKEDKKKSKITDIIHDADFLSKSGPIGIGVYFAKGILRGESLLKWINNSASKELTYSLNLLANMRTKTGQSLAHSNNKFTRKFFKELFSDLKEKGIMDLGIKTYKIKRNNCKKKIKIVIVSLNACDNCGATLETNFSFETGIKCEKIISAIDCPVCHKHFGTKSFCLPEICKHP